MSRSYRLDIGKPGRSSDWTWKLTVNGVQEAGGSAGLESIAFTEAHRYGRQYAADGDCRIVVNPPKGYRP